MADIFISYSRQDKAFAKALCEALEKLNHQVWIDWQGIRSAQPWETEILEGIQAATRFIYIISPDAAASKYCQWEVEQAIANQKKLIPVLCREIDLKTLPLSVTQLQMISFCSDDSFSTSIEKLMGVISADLEYDRFYIKLEQRYQEWLKQDRQEGFLRGRDLEEAETWLATSAGKNPPPNDLQKGFIQTSRQQQQQETERWKNLYEEAERRRLDAEFNEIKALCKSSEALFVVNRISEALQEAFIAGKKLQASPQASSDTKLRQQVTQVLRQAAFMAKEYNRIHGHSAPVWSIAISPDETHFATASTDGTIKIWQVDGTLKTVIENSENGLSHCLQFSPKESLLASAHIDGYIKLWQLEGTCLQEIPAQDYEINTLDFSPDGQRIASAGSKGIVKIHSLEGQLLATQATHQAWIRTVKFSPDGQSLAIASSNASDSAVWLWQPPNQILEKLDGANALQFSPDGSRLALSRWDKVHLTDLTGKILVTYQGHRQQVVAVTFSPDGETLATASSDGTVKIWNLSGEVLQTLHHDSSVNDVTFSPSGNTLMSVASDGSISGWRLHNPLLKVLSTSRKKLYGVSVSPDGKFLTSSDEECGVKLCRINGELVRILDGHQDVVFHAPFSLDSQTIATASFDHTVKLWDLDGNVLNIFQHQNRAWSVSFCPNGQSFVVGGYENIIRHWDRDGHLIKTFLMPENCNSECVSISFDGSKLVAGTTTAKAYVWSMDGTLLHELSRHARAVCGVAWSPDDTIIATASRDNTVILWNLDGEVIAKLQGHQSWVTAVTFSPDGQYVATTSFDNTLKIWQLNGNLLATLKGHEDAVCKLDFSPDGKFLFSAGHDGKLLRWQWNLTFEELLDWTQDWAKDYIKSNQRKEELVMDK